MPIMLIKVLQAMLSNMKVLIFILIYSGYLRVSLPAKFEQTPAVSIRKGRITIGKVKARKNLRLNADGGRIEINDGCFFNNDCSITSRCNVTICSNTLLGENVKIYDHDHEFSEVTGVSHTNFVNSPVKIGRNCWIGANTTILKGVTISDNVLIAAGSIVNKSIDQPGVYIYRNGVMKRVNKSELK